jgi:hypothetical protein
MSSWLTVADKRRGAMRVDLRHTLRASVLIFALGCTAVFYGQVPALAQDSRGNGGGGNALPGFVGPDQEEPAVCWILESNFEPRGHKPIWKRPLSPVVPVEGLWPDTVGPDVAQQLFDGDPSSINDGKNLVVTAQDGTIRAVSVPCPPSTLTVVGQPPPTLYFIGEPPGRYKPVQVGSSGQPWIGGYLASAFASNNSTTTITSPTDRQKIKQDPEQVLLTGRANFGPWFLTGQATFAGSPHGSFSDVFPATPAFNTTATVNSGNVYGFNGDAGYTVWNAHGWNIGLFGGYYSFNEELYGVFPGFAGTFSLLNDHWRAGEGGISVDKVFRIGAEPFDLGVTVAGLYDNLRSGAFNGNGGGVRVNGTLSFPLGPVIGNIYAQYADLNASGSNTGMPLTFKDEVWTVGFGVSYKFGAPPASAAASTYPVKALPPK